MLINIDLYSRRIVRTRPIVGVDYVVLRDMYSITEQSHGLKHHSSQVTSHGLIGTLHERTTPGT